MKLVVFGLAISSSWGNGHATLWRGLCAALARAGHQVVFFEHDMPWYAAHRDYRQIPNGELNIYGEWAAIAGVAEAQVRSADAVFVTSYCPDALVATALVLGTEGPLKCFYDLDTPVTLERLAAGEAVPYVGPEGFRGFDLVLSFTGGGTLDLLRERLGATRVAPLYGSVDPVVHCPVRTNSDRVDLSYLGTYASDRQPALEALFLEPARQSPQRRFAAGGSQYPDDFEWPANVAYASHVPPPEHAAFYCASNLTLNVTRGPMAALGYCPSGRLFEAAACGVPVLSDWWPGIDSFFEPGSEILIAQSTDDVLASLRRPTHQLGEAAYRRVIADHTADRRAEQLIGLLDKGD